MTHEGRFTLEERGAVELVLAQRAAIEIAEQLRVLFGTGFQHGVFEFRVRLAEIIDRVAQEIADLLALGAVEGRSQRVGPL